MTKIFNPMMTRINLLLMAISLMSANAFVAVPSRVFVTTTTTTALDASTIYSDFEHAYDNNIMNNNNNNDIYTPPQELDPKFTTPVTNTNNNNNNIKKKAISTNLEIPRHVRPTVTEIENAKVLMSLEAVLGRGAMLAAIVLMTTEITTGMSLPEQLSKLF